MTRNWSARPPSCTRTSNDHGSHDKLRVVALHHQMVGAPWRTRKKPVARRTHVLATLVDSGAELIIGGHIHQGAVSERHEFEVITGDARGVVVSIAPGLGQPRPERRGEARGCVVYRADERTLTVDTYIWREDDWGLTAVRTFPRGRQPLAVDLPSRSFGRGTGSDERDEPRRDQDGKDEPDQSADDQAGDQGRHHTDHERQPDRHRVVPGVHEPSEGTDDQAEMMRSPMMNIAV